MGWTGASITRKQAEQEILATSYHKNGNVVKTRKHAKSGNELWYIRDGYNPDGSLIFSYIGVSIFEKHQGKLYWKDMDESMGPYYYECPVAWFDEVPESGNGEWRENVRQYAARRAEQAAYRVGDRIEFPEGWNPHQVRLLSKQKGSWLGTTGERLVKIGPKHLKMSKLVPSNLWVAGTE